MRPAAREGVAILEITALGAALVILDTMDKAARVRLLQAELNDYYGFVLKVAGDVSALDSAVGAARETAERLHAKCVATVIAAPDERAWRAIESKPEHQPLIQQKVVIIPAGGPPAGKDKSAGEPSPAGERVKQKEQVAMSTQAPFAIGMIETQGFTAVLEAIDTACKAANVEILAKEKLGGGYITVLIKGDVAAVNAAIEAGRAKVPDLGKLIAAHVIPRPSAAVLSLLTAI